MMIPGSWRSAVVITTTIINGRQKREEKESVVIRYIPSEAEVQAEFTPRFFWFDPYEGVSDSRIPTSSSIIETKIFSLVTEVTKSKDETIASKNYTIQLLESMLQNRKVAPSCSLFPPCAACGATTTTTTTTTTTGGSGSGGNVVVVANGTTSDLGGDSGGE